MLTYWITRLTVPALAVCGLVLLPGCHDDKDDAACNDCGDAPAACAEGTTTTTVSQAQAPITEGSAQFETSYKPEGSYDADGHRETMALRERLATIERERMLYPERASQLDQEANQIRSRLELSEKTSRVSEPMGPASTSYRPQVTAPESNINVTNRNYIDENPAALTPNTNNDQVRVGTNSAQRVPDGFKNNEPNRESVTKTVETTPDVDTSAVRDNRVEQDKGAINTSVDESERDIPDVNQEELQK